MPTPIIDQLMDLAQAVRVARGPDPEGAGGRVARVALALPEGFDGLKVTETVTSTNVELHDVNLSQFAKHVRFDVSDVASIGGVDAATPLKGGQPISVSAAQLEKVTLGNTAQPGLPGSLGALRGQLPVARAVNSALPHTVTAEVRWSFRDEDGRVVFDVDWQIGPGGAARRGRGGEVNPSADDALEPLFVALPVAFVERAGDEAVTRRFVHASVRLVAAGISTPWVEVPRLEVHRLAVETPTVLALFAGANYEGARAVLVPGGSPLTSAAVVKSALEALRDELAVLAGGETPNPEAFPPPLTHLSPALRSVRRLIDIVTGTTSFARADECRSLRLVKLRPDGDAEPVGAEDSVRSLILIGPAGRRLRCFNSRDLIDGEGQMLLACGRELSARVAELAASSPSGEPPHSLTVVSQPRGGIRATGEATFGGLSSLRFE